MVHLHITVMADWTLKTSCLHIALCFCFLFVCLFLIIFVNNLIVQVGHKVMKELNKTLSTFVIDMFEAQVANIPKKAMVIFEDCVYTYEFMNQQANRVANMMRQLGFKLGDTVAIMINNEPAFIWTLLGKLFISA